MDNPVTQMEKMQSGCHIAEMVDQLFRSGKSFAFHVLFQIAAVHVLHDDKGFVTDLSAIVDRDNGGMGYGSKQFGFIVEAFHHIAEFAFGLGDFDHDPAHQNRVDRPVNSGHATVAAQFFQKISAENLGGADDRSTLRTGEFGKGRQITYIISGAALTAVYFNSFAH